MVAKSNNRKRKYDYERLVAMIAHSETRHAPKFDVSQAPAELQEVIAVCKQPRGPERSQWLNDYVVKSWSVSDGEAEVLVSAEHLNKTRYINRYLRQANAKLKQDGYFVGSFDTEKMRRMKIFAHYPQIVAYIVYFFDFLWHRMFPKLPLLRRFYYLCTNKVRKVIPRPEMLGRFYYCGFDVVSEKYIHDRYYILAQKKREPSTEPHTNGMIVRLKRVGKDGKLFNVYKFRTMYAYSEFLQGYVYENNDLDKGGKFKDDYRVTEWGRWLRRLWIDELPTVFNILLGQMKLVGVRPLSQQYFDLYSKDLQQFRVKTKPGLFPPYYVDMPDTLEEIQESERRYLEAYFEHPFRTDWQYFWKIVGNIVFKGKRSK
ncbi:MAG: sugar transferase [Bacteroidales bacterium]|nr:sugar transferase [Bacteroidales bacterium]